MTLHRALVLPFIGSTALVALLALAALLNCGGGDPSEAPRPEADAAPDARPRRDAERGDEGDVPKGSATEGPGTRFKPVTVLRTYEDGTKEQLFEGVFWDTQLRTICFLREVTPDVYACVPELAWAEEAFSDSDCRTPVYKLIGGTSAAFAHIGTDWCSPKIVQIGATREGRTYQKTPTGCSQDGAQSSLFDPTSPVAYSSFGVFTRTIDTTPFPRERSGSRLVLESVRLAGNDGSFEVRAPRIVDLIQKSEGAVFFAMDGKLRFFPAARRLANPYSSAFADANCSEPVLTFERDYSVCHDDPFAWKGGLIASAIGPGCSGMRAVSRPSQAPLEAIYWKPGASCTGAAVPLAYHAYPVQPLAEIPAESLAEVTRTIAPNERRNVPGSAIEARSVVYSSADGLELQEREASLYLRKYDVPCRADALGDGVTRCVPDVAIDNASGHYFADAACTQPVLMLFSTSACVGPLSPLYRGDSPTGKRIFKRPSGDPLTITTVYLKEGTGCRAMDVHGGTYTYFPAGEPEEVPVSDFPRLTSSTVDYGE